MNRATYLTSPPLVPWLTQRVMVWEATSAYVIF